MINIEQILNKICKGFHVGVAPEEVVHYKDTIKRLTNDDNQRWSLHRSLHYMGDDNIKAEIEHDLKIVLDSETFALVEAIFHWNVNCDDL